MLTVGLALAVLGIALNRGIEWYFSRLRAENMFFDALEEWLFHPILSALLYLSPCISFAGFTVAGLGLIL